MYSFTYLRPVCVQEVVDLLSRHPEARPLSRGMTLISTLKQQLSAPTHLVDLTRLAESQGIERRGSVLRIGAATRHADVARSDCVRQAIPALSDLAASIGDQEVRNRGTIGGSLANCDPAADYLTSILALKAAIVTDRRRIVADEFFLGMFETALAPAEIITVVEFPIPSGSAYVKHRHRASGYAVVGVIIADHTGEARVTVTGAGACAFRWMKAEARLASSAPSTWDSGLLAQMQSQAEGLNQDFSATEDYRAHLVGTLARRALAALQPGALSTG